MKWFKFIINKIIGTQIQKLAVVKKLKKDRHKIHQNICQKIHQKNHQKIRKKIRRKMNMLDRMTPQDS